MLYSSIERPVAQSRVRSLPPNHFQYPKVILGRRNSHQEPRAGPLAVRPEGLRLISRPPTQASSPAPSPQTPSAHTPPAPPAPRAATAAYNPPPSPIRSR